MRGCPASDGRAECGGWCETVWWLGPHVRHPLRFSRFSVQFTPPGPALVGASCIVTVRYTLLISTVYKEKFAGKKVLKRNGSENGISRSSQLEGTGLPAHHAIGCPIAVLSIGGMWR